MPVLSVPASPSANLASGSNLSTSSILVFAGIGISIFGIFGLLFFVIRKRLCSIIGIQGGCEEHQADATVFNSDSQVKTDPKISATPDGVTQDTADGSGLPNATVAAPKFVPRPLLLHRKLSADPLTMQPDWRLLTKEAEDRRREEALLTDACARAARIRRGRSIACPGQIITCAQAENKRYGVASFIISPVTPASVDGSPSVMVAEDTKRADTPTDEESSVENDKLEELSAAMSLSVEEQAQKQKYHEPELDVIMEVRSIFPNICLSRIKQLCETGKLYHQRR